MSNEMKERFVRLASAVAERRDQTAFAELFDYFAPRLKSYLMRLGMEPGQAEELTQEVMIVLWHKAGLFDPVKSSLSTWLFRIARNRRIDAFRRDKSALLDADDPALQPSQPESADDIVEAEERDERVRRAMLDLPDEQAELVKQAFFLGRSHSQIAEDTGLPLGTVKSRIRLAFSRLRRSLESDGGEMTMH
ncbi:MAG: RNA polymerase subunit sigma [Hoeflea sp.]|mgnify:FL=1|uniref:sigma-70 family RNA polymerase sigma factor n=1 Tax=Hoeflea sp. TaxID=1940281 RepID=UPI000C0DFEBF|nr:sigma-70 family RNA polymerase sigma factor [Hoeflea sp.]PHR17709.1 MAG: RNA polymerase subunit sigma [Hoeflea sp.]|tara:strand:- start:6976 stop:7551 length:576 start_codon:yes stop_codon:yes gene_type:complete